MHRSGDLRVRLCICGATVGGYGSVGANKMNTENVKLLAEIVELCLIIQHDLDLLTEIDAESLQALKQHISKARQTALNLFPTAPKPESQS